MAPQMRPHRGTPDRTFKLAADSEPMAAFGGSVLTATAARWSIVEAEYVRV